MNKQTLSVTKERVKEDLHVYGIMQRKIKDFKDEIEQIKIAGLPKASKDITSFDGKDGYISVTPEMIKIEGAIKHLTMQISTYKLRCVNVQSALRSIKPNEFYKAFYDIYIEGKAINDISKYAEYKNYHENSIRYHMDKLLTRVGQELYPEFIFSKRA